MVTIFLIALAVLLVSGLFLIGKIAVTIGGVLIVIAVIKWLLSKVIKKNCDFIATIPMTGKINSLNASVSCAIVLSGIINNRK